MNKVPLIRRESSRGETDVKGGSFTSGSVGGEPFEVARAASGDGPGDKFWGVIRMGFQHMSFQLSQARLGGFEDHQDLDFLTKFAFPPVMRFHARHEVGAGGQTTFENAGGQLAGHVQARCGNEDDVVHGAIFNAPWPMSKQFRYWTLDNCPFPFTLQPMNQIDLSGRNAVVTGGARGIGYAIAQRLLQSGASVSVWDVDPEAAAEAKAGLSEHGPVDTQTVELTDADAVAAATEGTIRALGHIDILCNNAGIAGGNYKTWEYPVEEFRRVIDVDLNAVFICCRAVVPHMRERGYGRIINTASIAGKEGNPNASAYSAAKAGVIGLTKSLGKELATDGICVNCFTPAVIQTDILKQITQQHIDYMLSKIPMGRFGEVEEAGALVAWLASEDCSFTTGGVFDLSGGRATY